MHLQEVRAVTKIVTRGLADGIDAVRDDAEGGQRDDIDLRMPKEPEQMLPQQRRSAQREAEQQREREQNQSGKDDMRQVVQQRDHVELLYRLNLHDAIERRVTGRVDHFHKRLRLLQDVTNT